MRGVGREVVLVDSSVERYDLETDLGERNDLAASMPDRAEGMRVMLTEWRTASGAELPTRPLGPGAP